MDGSDIMTDDGTLPHDILLERLHILANASLQPLKRKEASISLTPLPTTRIAFAFGKSAWASRMMSSK